MGVGPAAPLVARPTSAPITLQAPAAMASTISLLTAATSGAPSTPIFSARS